MESKTVLITGASRGIGAAAARAFAAAGYAVAVHYHTSEAEALALVRELTAAGHTAIAVRADVSDPAQVEKMVDNVLEKFCQLDILVCNAGVSETGLVSQIDEERWRRLFTVNVDGVHHCCQAVLPHMIHRKAGSIVTVSSIWGLCGASCEAAYSAAKAGVIGLTQALAKELAPSGITVNCVAPGAIDTQMNAHLGPEALRALAEETPLGRLGAPEDVANTLLFLASEGASFLTGQVIGVDGGFL